MVDKKLSQVNLTSKFRFFKKLNNFDLQIVGHSLCPCKSKVHILEGTYSMYLIISAWMKNKATYSDLDTCMTVQVQ